MIGRVAIACGVVGVLYVLAISVQHAFTPPPAPTVKSPGKVDECSDDCEQRSIIEQWPDGKLQACRRVCRGEAGPPPPRETPSKITVAPSEPAKPPPIAPVKLR